VAAHRINNPCFPSSFTHFAAMIGAAIMLDVNRAAMLCFSAQIRAAVACSGHLFFLSFSFRFKRPLKRFCPAWSRVLPFSAIKTP
jgi:hypothetical protein